MRNSSSYLPEFIKKRTEMVLVLSQYVKVSLSTANSSVRDYIRCYDSNRSIHDGVFLYILNIFVWRILGLIWSRRINIYLLHKQTISTHCIVSEIQDIYSSAYFKIKSIKSVYQRILVLICRAEFLKDMFWKNTFLKCYKSLYSLIIELKSFYRTKYLIWKIKK